MKTFPWLLTLALIAVCLTGWAMSEWVERSMRDTMAALPVPYVTRLVILPHTWLLAVPLPWVVYAGLLTFRRELTAGAALLFAGTLFLVATLLVCALAIALTIPYIPRIP
jgi:TRAP-type C4-dicarboxylate transport system permease small subunit